MKCSPSPVSCRSPGCSGTRGHRAGGCNGLGSDAQPTHLRSRSDARLAPENITVIQSICAGQEPGQQVPLGPRSPQPSAPRKTPLQSQKPGLALRLCLQLSAEPHGWFTTMERTGALAAADLQPARRGSWQPGEIIKRN